MALHLAGIASPRYQCLRQSKISKRCQDGSERDRKCVWMEEAVRTDEGPVQALPTKGIWPSPANSAVPRDNDRAFFVFCIAATPLLVLLPRQIRCAGHLVYYPEHSSAPGFHLKFKSGMNVSSRHDLHSASFSDINITQMISYEYLIQHSSNGGAGCFRTRSYPRQMCIA